MDKFRQKKLRSKVLRLKYSDEIREIIKASSLFYLEETQVGNFIYRANGFFTTLGDSGAAGLHKATLSIKMGTFGPEIHLFLSHFGVGIKTPMDLKEFKASVKELKKSVFN